MSGQLILLLVQVPAQQGCDVEWLCRCLCNSTAKSIFSIFPVLLFRTGLKVQCGGFVL